MDKEIKEKIEDTFDSYRELFKSSDKKAATTDFVVTKLKQMEEDIMTKIEEKEEGEELKEMLKHPKGKFIKHTLRKNKRSAVAEAKTRAKARINDLLSSYRFQLLTTDMDKELGIMDLKELFDLLEERIRREIGKVEVRGG